MLRKILSSTLTKYRRVGDGVWANVQGQVRTLQGLKGYDEKENAEEAIFSKKEDEKLLESLLAKVRAQAEQHDVHSAKGVLAAEKSALDEIVGSKLSSTQKDALIEWKHTHF